MEYESRLEQIRHLNVKYWPLSRLFNNHQILYTPRASNYKLQAYYKLTIANGKKSNNKEYVL